MSCHWCSTPPQQVPRPGLSKCVHRVSHRDLNPDRTFRASSIARHHHRAESSNARHHASRAIVRRAALSSRGILIAWHHHARYSPSRGIVIVRHNPSHGIVIVRHNPSHGIIIAWYHHRAVSNNKLLFIGTPCRPRNLRPRPAAPPHRPGDLPARRALTAPVRPP
jgi:hypothetical protein